MRSMKLLAVVLILLAVASLSVTPGLAGPKSNGHGPDAGTTTPTIQVQPNPVAAQGAQYTVTGSGFEPSQLVYLSMSSPGCCLGFNVMADDGGAIAFNRSTGEAGTYAIDAYQWNQHRFVLKATVLFDVTGP
jgi:hypothetical protein